LLFIGAFNGCSFPIKTSMLALAECICITTYPHIVKCENLHAMP
jgi:hypothetical protein